jgi:predicted O-methyltransferase YrrM
MKKSDSQREALNRKTISFKKNRKERDHIKFIGDLSKQDVSVLIKYIKKASNILEFGVGGSTQIICKIKKKSARFISIDTSQDWIDRTIDNLQLLSIKADVNFFLYGNWEQSIEGISFDFIFDDGVPDLRKDFGLTVWKYLNVGGSLLIHDTRTIERIRDVELIIDNYYLEIDSILANTNHSNITVITKKMKEPYTDWNIVENKRAWEYGQGVPPKNLWDSNHSGYIEDHMLMFKLQMRGFFDDLPDEVLKAFTDINFEKAFLRYLFYKEQDLIEELYQEMNGSKLMDEFKGMSESESMDKIFNNITLLKTKFTEIVINFMKIFREE